MCENCNDPGHIAGFGRRNLLLGGAGLAAVPFIAAASSPSYAQDASAEDGSRQISVRAFGNGGPKEPFKQIEIPRRALQPNDILIDVMYCAICHSDIHITRQEWGPPYPATNYPCVPGHEIVGRVTAVGSAVTKFQVGDIAGAGAMIESCGECENCKNGLEQYCFKGWKLNFNTPDPVLGGYNYGGFSDKVVVAERFVVRVPPGVNLAATSPLLCAGITTFSPMQHWKVEKGQRIGVIGMGGLGHIAVKLGVARGADVTVFTTTAAKVEDAKRLGAREAVVWTDPEVLKPFANQFDS